MPTRLATSLSRDGQVIAELVNLIVSFALVVFTIGLLRSYVLTRIGAKRGGGEQ